MKLRNLLFVFIFCIGLFLYQIDSHGAFTSDNIADFASLSSSTVVNLPDGDWCMAGWVKAGATSVSNSFSRLTSIDNPSTDAAWDFAITNGGIGTAFDELTLVADDDDTTTITLTGTTSDFASNTNWTHIAAERSGSDFTIYVNGSSVATASNASFDAITSGTDTFRFFNRDSVDRGFNGSMADWAAWETPCNHLAELARGYSAQFFPEDRNWFAPMIVNYQEIEGGLTVTNSGTAVSAHPPLRFPSD